MIINTRPDITKESSSKIKTTLDWVGISDVELPILLQEKNLNCRNQGAKVNIFVSLDDPHAKGIHMSRLYLIASKNLGSHILNRALLEQICDELILSHENLSLAAKIEIFFDYILLRPALISKEQGWRFYPVKLSCSKKGQEVKFAVELKILYSSTCPCSAALARQINANVFLENFANRELVSVEAVYNWLLSIQSQTAVPHAQRSEAHIKLELDQWIDLEIWINEIESLLGTAVQASVKREDEQEFARLNGTNMMFSEDACRKIKNYLETKNLINFEIKVEHIESLHPHNAVSIAG